MMKKPYDKKFDDAVDRWMDEALFQLGNASDKYGMRLEEYGESWRTCTMKFLRGRLREEFKEWNESEVGEMETEELYDIVNVCMMLLIRHEEAFNDDS